MIMIAGRTNFPSSMAGGWSAPTQLEVVTSGSPWRRDLRVMSPTSYLTAPPRVAMTRPANFNRLYPKHGLPANHDVIPLVYEEASYARRAVLAVRTTTVPGWGQVGVRLRSEA